MPLLQTRMAGIVGAKVDLLLLDAAADMGPEEQSALEASIGRGLAGASRGRPG